MCNFSFHCFPSDSGSASGTSALHDKKIKAGISISKAFAERQKVDEERIRPFLLLVCFVKFRISFSFSAKLPHADETEC